MGKKHFAAHVRGLHLTWCQVFIRLGYRCRRGPSKFVDSSEYFSRSRGHAYTDSYGHLRFSRLPNKFEPIASSVDSSCAPSILSEGILSTVSGWLKHGIGVGMFSRYGIGETSKEGMGGYVEAVGLFDGTCIKGIFESGGSEHSTTEVIGGRGRVLGDE